MNGTSIRARALSDPLHDLSRQSEIPLRVDLGHVRVGMEDNLYYKKGEKLKSNAQLVERVKKLAEEMNREVATVAQAREMLGLPAKPKS